MFGFIAIIRKSADSFEVASHDLGGAITQKLPHFHLCHSSRSVKVYAFTESPKVFSVIQLQDHGVIFGALFRRTSRGSQSIQAGALPDAEVDSIIKTQGRRLINEYWGNYVALASVGDNGEAFALRSPLGGIPIQWIEWKGCYVVFSHAADIAQLEMADWTIDWEYLKFHERYHFLETQDSCFLEVKKLIQGWSAFYTPTGVQVENYWPAAKVCAPVSYGSVEERAKLMRDTLVDVVGAWASRFDRICHRLSGGLDSSIITCCLRLAGVPTKVTCFNYYSPTTGADERYYANAVAEANGYDIRWIPDRLGNQRYDLLPTFPLGEKPLDEIISAYRAPTEYPIIEATEAEAVFDGIPGDMVFFQGDINFAIDYLRQRGFGPGFLRTVAWAARRTKRSVWAIAAEALRERLVPTNNPMYAKIDLSEAPLLSDEDKIQVGRDQRIQNWLDELGSFPPGKQMQAMLIFRAGRLTATAPSGQRYLMIHPIETQPFYELCLSMPIYDLVWKGWDRGLARLAFADVLPRQILVRENKGGMDAHMEAVFRENLPLFRTYFKDSVLVKHGVLDANKVAKGISGEVGQGMETRQAFLVTIATEIWARRWLDLIESSKAAGGRRAASA